METIAQIAIELKVSRQAVYQKIKESGLSIDNLTVEKRGNKRILSEEGVEVVKSLFVKKGVTVKMVSQTEFDKLAVCNMSLRSMIDELSVSLNAVRKEVEDKEVTINRLTERLGVQEQMVSMLQTEKEMLYLALEKAQKIADQAQQLEAARTQEVKKTQEEKQRLLERVEVYMEKTSDQNNELVQESKNGASEVRRQRSIRERIMFLFTGKIGDEATKNL